MIEKALRKHLEPVVNRRRVLYLRTRLGLFWLLTAVAALVMLMVERYYGLGSPAGVGLLCFAAVFATLYAVYRSRRIEPDYREIARRIEKRHPEARALLRAAVEQQPQGPDGKLGYLQEAVIGEALKHAGGHNWNRSVPGFALVLANLSQFAALAVLVVLLVQILPGAYPVGRARPPVARKGFGVVISPGDAEVEAGSPVVVTARFEGRMPDDAALVFTRSGAAAERVTLTRNLDDPVYAGIIESVDSDTVYHVEYEDRRTDEYKLSAFIHPLLSSIDAKIVYPVYTGLSEKLVKDTRRVSVIEGSQVELTFTLNKPVQTARMTSEDKPSLDLVASKSYANIYTATIEAAESRRYEVKLTDSEGRTNKVPPRFVLNVHKNLPVEIKPTFPNRDVQASALEELSLEARLSDDYGILDYGVSFTMAGRQSQDISLKPAQTARRQTLDYLMAMEELGAQPDDLVTYAFWAEDAGPKGEIRRTFSDMYFAEIRPFEESFSESESDQSRQQQQQQQQQNQQQGSGRAEQLIQLQKQIINATWNVKRNSSGFEPNEARADIDVILESQGQALEQAQTAMEQAQQPAEADALFSAAEYMETAVEHLDEAASGEELDPALASEQAAYQQLLKLRERQSQVARSSSSSSSSSQGASVRSQQQLRQLEMSQQESRYESQRQAQSRQQAQRGEDLQMQNRLRELARHQNEMSQRLRELEAELREAESEDQRKQARRELRRLRDQQQQALRDLDELRQQMEQPENRNRTAEAREHLDGTRSNVRRASEQIEQGMVSDAAASATRAGRELDQMRQEFQRRTSSQFAEQMSNMREDARELDQRQREISDRLSEQVDTPSRALAESPDNEELAERVDRQRTETEQLLNRMRDLVAESEESEPLLSSRLYDTLREASTANVDQTLEITSRLLRRDFVPQAREVEERAAESIESIREGVERAAEGILGDEADSLRLARQTIDQLLDELDRERVQNAAVGLGGPNDVNQPFYSTATGAFDPNGALPLASADPNDPQVASAQVPRGRQQLGDNSPQRSRQQQQNPSGQPGQGQQDSQQQDSQQQENGRQGQSGRQGRQGERADSGGQRQQPGGRQRNGPPEGDRRRVAARGAGGYDQSRLEGLDRYGPLTGGEFREWSDRLREVEEMLTTRDMRTEVLRVRSRARRMREDYKRHGSEPQWDIVDQQIVNPLAELSSRLAERLAQIESDEALVRIDRDPVPDRFSELVRSYFENLGEED